MSHNLAGGLSESMLTSVTNPGRRPLRTGQNRAAWLMMTLLLSTTGCAAFRPMDGVPARYLPAELKGQSRETMRMIDLSLLGREPIADYRVDTGDVLAVYVENIIGQPSNPPINQHNNDRPPTLGYPLTIRDDGTIAVPRAQPIYVRGRTIPEVEQLVRNAFVSGNRYLDRNGPNRVVVSLHQPRQYRVLVVRQESQNDALSGINIRDGSIGLTKRGAGQIVSLAAGKNDVLHALMGSGGLPGVDAENVVWVIRSKQARRPDAALAMAGQQQRVQPMPGQPGTIPQQPGMPPRTRPLPQQFVPGASSMQPQQTRGGMVAPGYATPPGGAVGPSASSGAIQQMGHWVMDPAPSTPADLISRTAYQNRNPVVSGPPMQGQAMYGAPIHRPPTGNPAVSLPPAGAFAPGSGFNRSGGAWQPPQAWNDINSIASGEYCSNHTVRIPLRLDDYEPLNITASDVTLQDGDIIFIQSRDEEVFYTGGLLGGGQYSLPKDTDLDILEAISIAQSQNQGQDLGRSALNNDVTISASQAIIIRKLPNGGQVPILVDLYRARKFASERILVQPGDYVVLQYTKLEAVGAFFERHILESALFGLAAAQFNSN